MGCIAIILRIVWIIMCVLAAIFAVGGIYAYMNGEMSTAIAGLVYCIVWLVIAIVRAIIKYNMDD